MKKYLVFVIVLVTLIVIIVFALLLLQHRRTSGITLNREKSWFSSYEVEEKNVRIYCHLVISNNSDKELSIVITGSSPTDYTSGLLKSEHLQCVSSDGITEEFVISPKEENLQLDVVFIGEYGGNPEKQNRLLPEIISVKDVETGVEYEFHD